MIVGDENRTSVVKIDLAFNNLTRFESSVFQTILESFRWFGGYPKAYVSIDESKLNSFYITFFFLNETMVMFNSLQTQLIVVAAICRG